MTKCKCNKNANKIKYKFEKCKIPNCKCNKMWENTKCDKMQNVIKCKHDIMQNQHITNVIKNAKIRCKFSLIKELYIKGT